MEKVCSHLADTLIENALSFEIKSKLKLALFTFLKHLYANTVHIIIK